MDGHARILNVRHVTERQCWMAEVEADLGFGYHKMLVSGKSTDDIEQHLRKQYRTVTRGDER